MRRKKNLLLLSVAPMELNIHSIAAENLAQIIIAW